MIDRIWAEAEARAWIDAWNHHDLDGVMAHYAGDLEFVSPLVVHRLGRPDGTIRNRSELRTYFAASLEPGSMLRFDLCAVLCGVGSYTILCRNHRGQDVAETVFPGPDGRITKAYIHHAG